MPAPTIETLPICSSVRTSLAREAERLERLGGDRQVVAGDREGEVGAVLGRDRLVLDDHVDVDVGLGERA